MLMRAASDRVAVANKHLMRYRSFLRAPRFRGPERSCYLEPQFPPQPRCFS
jgi:hypothetical protein